MSAAQYRWARYGAGYECSTRGDRRFSALCVYLSDGRTIEEHYQCDVKAYQPGGREWRRGKGKPALRECDQWGEYLSLWREWAVSTSRARTALEELRVLADQHGGLLTDAFATSPINQAHALSVLLNEL